MILDSEYVQHILLPEIHLPQSIFVESLQPRAHKKRYLMEKMGVQLVCLHSQPNLHDS